MLLITIIQEDYQFCPRNLLVHNFSKLKTPTGIADKISINNRDKVCHSKVHNRILSTEILKIQISRLIMSKIRKTGHLDNSSLKNKFKIEIKTKIMEIKLTRLFEKNYLNSSKMVPHKEIFQQKAQPKAFEKTTKSNTKRTASII